MNPGWVSRRVSIWLLVALALAAAPAGAQEANVDPPGRVARLSYIEGDVTLAPDGSEEWADAVLNRPLTSGDRLYVNGGRAELQIGSSTVHLDERTGFGFIQLDDDVIQMSLIEGAASIRVRSLGERESIQVQTPNGTVHLLHPGEYFVQVDPKRDQTIVKARSGEAEVVGDSKTYRVRANEEGVFTGLEELQASIHPIPPRTAFESWANDRERERQSSQSSRYVSSEVIGYEDLDDHGDWYDEPAYGYVWRPRYVAHDWAPYRYGRWVWVRPWGWTWVDDTRWGFAPFHYGRWAYVRSNWCWVPGPRHLRPVYSPALVGWVGVAGPSFSVSLSFGNGVGWFPLAPHEIYVPGYWHTPRYIRHVNVSNTIIFNQTHLTNAYSGRYHPRDYRHGGLANAVTLANREAFISGRSLAGQRVHVNDRDLRGWRHDARPPAIAPNRDSILGGEPRLGRRVGGPVSSGRNPKDAGDFRVTREVNPNALGDARGQRSVRPIKEHRSNDVQIIGSDGTSRSSRTWRSDDLARSPGPVRLTDMPRSTDMPRRTEHGVNGGPIKRDVERARTESRGDDSLRPSNEALRRDQWHGSPTPALRSNGGAVREQSMPRQPSYRSEPRQASPVIREARPQARGQSDSSGSAVRRSDSGSARQHGNSGGNSGGSRGNSSSRGDSRGHGGSRTQQP